MKNLKEVDKEMTGEFDMKIGLIEDNNGDSEINSVRHEVPVRVAMDSGAVRSVTHKMTIPNGVEIIPNTSGKHFNGAGGDVIIKHGECITLMTGKTGNKVAGRWQVADVTRPLHSVSEVCGPEDHPTGHHDVLFNNKRCVVVPPGVVEHIMKHINHVAEYPREGNLYVAEMMLSSFTRQGPGM